MYPIVLIPAITLIYGQVQLDNLFANGRFFLKSPDEKLNVYKMNSTTACIQTKYDDFKPEFIPFTINNSWPETNLSKSASQAFFVLQTIVPYYNELGIEFEKIHCCIACNSNGLSNAYGTSKGNEAYILVSDDFGSGLGENKTAKYSIFDVIGHELCHAYLDRFFKSNEGYGKALMHEGISDVFGNFVEILYQGFEDWINEDDIGEIGRQANLPVCYTDVKDSHDPHITGTVIGHWYFLATRNTNVLTHNEVMEILIEALKIGKSNLHDIKDLLYATLVATGKKYGINSSEYKLIADSWNAVCLGPIPTSNFTVEGPITMCEEDDQLTLCISGGFPYSSYKWTVIGTKGTEWVLQGSYPQIGNSVITSGATCLQVLDIPKYSYYPKPITIRVCQQISVPGAYRCADHKLKLIDCDGQDPNCNQTSSQIQIFGNENSNSSEINISDYSIPLHNDREPILKVYDIYGRLLSTSKFEPDNLDNLRDYNSVLIIEIIDSKGTSHFTKKLFTKN